MKLATSFSIDPREPWVVEHNAEVREVLAAYEADRPIRVPLLSGEWWGQHGWYADEIGLDYREYYNDPDEMLRVQLEAARRRRELPICDMTLAEAPDHWDVSVDFWPVVGPGWFGCELLYRAESVIANHRLDLGREQCDELEMPDPREGGILATMRCFLHHLRERYEGSLSFLGRPVGPIGHGVGTNGPFCLALDLRGPGLMEDVYEDPAFASWFLATVASWCETLDSTWAGVPAIELGPFGISDHGIDMLSPETYEQLLVPLIETMNARRGTTPPSDLHHCGRGSHLFGTIRKHFGLTSIHNLTYPANDVAKVRRELGEEVWIQAMIEDSIIQQGPPARIREVVKALMSSGAKGSGRLAITMGDMLRGTPMEHRYALYEAVKEFGGY